MLPYYDVARYSVKTYTEEDEFYLVPEQLTTYGDLFPAKDNSPDADGVITNDNALVAFLQKVCCSKPPMGASVLYRTLMLLHSLLDVPAQDNMCASSTVPVSIPFNEGVAIDRYTGYLCVWITYHILVFQQEPPPPSHEATGTLESDTSILQSVHAAVVL